MTIFNGGKCKGSKNCVAYKKTANSVSIVPKMEALVGFAYKIIKQRSRKLTRVGERLKNKT